jgi:hypothetical protein
MLKPLGKNYAWRFARGEEACPPRDSIVQRGELRRCRALARQTEPRLCVATVKLG